jgi:UDP-galactopyranose mutase
MNEGDAKQFLDTAREKSIPIRTSEDIVLRSVGRDLCEKFFRGYTIKQWGVDLSDLDACVTKRIPVRTNTDDRYFTDAFQFMPTQGFTKLFETMLDHPKIDLALSTNFNKVKNRVNAKHTIFTGPIDEYFEFCYGNLPYRSLDFESQHIENQDCVQPVAVINYPNDFEYTRSTEFKHLTRQKCGGTSVMYEYPRSTGDPYYPIPAPQNGMLYSKYHHLAKKHPDISFIGRLAEYKYYNMDQVVLKAIETADHLIQNIFN